MEKKEKVKPRTDLNNNLKVKTFKYYNKEMEEETKSFIQKNQNASDTKFYLFQSIRNKDRVRDMIFNLAYFYDRNFVGNKDFMHIPNISDITANILNYPMIIASRKDEHGNDDIIGATTVKMENNDSLDSNPFFPSKHENILSITGILTKMNAVDITGNRLKGIGRELFKAAISGAYNLNKEENVRLICEVDCRNTNSFNSVCRAVKDLQDEGKNISLSITGYYEILNSEKKLKEAPTFVLEIDLNENKNLDNNKTKFSYSQCKSTDLFSDLSQVIKKNTKESKRFINQKNENIVIYHEIKKIDAFSVEIDVANTASGNEREPVLKSIQLASAGNATI